MEVIPYEQKFGAPSKQQIIMPQQNIIPPEKATGIAGQQPFGGLQFIYVKDPMLELASCSGVLVRQEPEFFEQITGCETPNRYHVFGSSPQGFKYLFKCKENSNCCMRNCFPSTQRQLDIEITHCASADPMDPITTKFANAYKPFKCAICCCCRPELILTLTEGKVQLGRIRHICTVCDPEFEIFDKNDELKYIANAYCCQCGLLCANNFLGKMHEAVFKIYTPGNKDEVGCITKSMATYSELVTDADTYQINFPSGANAHDKLLLLSLGLMIDYQYFETDSSDEKKKKEKKKKEAKKEMQL